MCDDMLEKDIEIEFINSIVENNEIDTISSIYKFYTQFENNQIFYDVLTLFFTGALDKNGINLYFNHMKNLYYDSTNSEEYVKLKSMFKKWKSISKTNINENYIYELNLLDKIKDKMFIFDMYQEFLNMNPFENYIKYETGIKYETRGIFSPLFNRKETNFSSKHLNNFNKIDVYEFIDVIQPLLNNEVFHTDLVEYIYHILCTNEEFTRENSKYINITNTSTISFNKFLLIILLELYSKIGVDKMEEKLSEKEFTKVKEYDIKNLSFEQKIIVTLAKAIPICHIGPIKLYHSEFNNLHRHKKFKFLTNEKQLKIMEEKVSSLLKIFSFDKSNIVMQNFYVDYYNKLKSKIFVDEIFMDILFFTDFITSFPQTKNVYGYVRQELYQVCSEILGNSQLNKHTRNYSAEVLFKLIPFHGFNIAPSFFNDLFSYIGEIDYYKWMSLLQAIKHHKKILQNMTMLLDYPKKVFEQSDKIISKTLYTLLGNAVESYTQFESICEKSKSNPINYQLEELFNDFFDIIMMTLNVYTNIYTQAIIKKSYSETEEKYSVLVHKLIESCLSEKSVINTILKQDNLSLQLLTITYQSLYNHIEMCAKHLAQHKKLIFDGYEKSGLSEDQIKKITFFLEENYKDDINYPEEFLDPLLYVPIVEPIMLPDIKEIHDRVAIVSQIHESGCNPYNRKPLTLEQLEEYNKLPEIVEKIKDFIERKKNFENIATQNHNK